MKEAKTLQEIKIHRAVAKLEKIDLFYLDSKTEGPLIICLHGRWGRAETWIDFMRRYGKSYRVVAPDLRGHGLSGKPVAYYTANEMADDILALLELLGYRQAIVIGHSMGARVAGYLAALHPETVRAAAILDRSAAGQAQLPLPQLDEVGAEDPLTKDWPLPFASRQEASEFIKKATDSPLSYQYFMNSLQETLDGYVMMFSSQAMAAGIAYDEDWFDLLSKIVCPVLLLRSQGQAEVSDADFTLMQELLGDCRAVQMSLPDHNVHLSDKREFYTHIDAFLRQVEQ